MPRVPLVPLDNILVPRALVLPIPAVLLAPLVPPAKKERFVLFRELPLGIVLLALPVLLLKLPWERRLAKVARRLVRPALTNLKLVTRLTIAFAPAVRLAPTGWITKLRLARVLPIGLVPLAALALGASTKPSLVTPLKILLVAPVRLVIPANILALRAPVLPMLLVPLAALAPSANKEASARRRELPPEIVLLASPVLLLRLPWERRLAKVAPVLVRRALTNPKLVTRPTIAFAPAVLLAPTE